MTMEIEIDANFPLRIVTIKRIKLFIYFFFSINKEIALGTYGRLIQKVVELCFLLRASNGYMQLCKSMKLGGNLVGWKSKRIEKDGKNIEDKLIFSLVR